MNLFYLFKRISSCIEKKGIQIEIRFQQPNSITWNTQRRQVLLPAFGQAQLFGWVGPGASMYCWCSKRITSASNLASLSCQIPLATDFINSYTPNPCRRVHKLDPFSPPALTDFILWNWWNIYEWLCFYCRSIWPTVSSSVIPNSFFLENCYYSLKYRRTEIYNVNRANLWAIRWTLLL